MQNTPKPLPAPSPETRRFWEAARAHKLELPFCRDCEAFFFYPRRFCPRCFSWDVDWRPVSGRGRVYTFAIQYRAFHPGWAGDTPYVTAIVELDEGPRLFTRLIDVPADPKALRCDMPVEVAFQDASEEISLPVFRPLDGVAPEATP